VRGRVQAGISWTHFRAFSRQRFGEDLLGQASMTKEKDPSRRDFLRGLGSAAVAGGLIMPQASAGPGAPQPDPLDCILFKELDKPNAQGMLEVSDNHRIYWEEFGNQKGEPILYLHGGPGAGVSRTHLRMIDPKHYLIIAFDQRGCGHSTFGDKRLTSKQVAGAKLGGENIDGMVKAMLKGNTTNKLVKDIVKLRKHLKIDKKMHIFGGSWGSTLALAYAIKHPTTVKSMTLRGVDLGRKTDNDWYYQGNATNLNDNTKAGAYQEYPEEWRRFVEHIPAKDRGNMFESYKRLLNSRDLQTVKDASIRLLAWGEVTSRMGVGKPEEISGCEAIKELPELLLEFEYFGNNCFFPDPDYILDHVGVIKDIPTIIVQGRHDKTCPLFMANALVNKWKEVQKDCTKLPEFHITTAGHSATEIETARKLVDATNEFARRDR
jgi:proline iminopeptidase